MADYSSPRDVDYAQVMAAWRKEGFRPSFNYGETLECLACGALVSERSRAVHREWHSNLEGSE